MLRAGVGVSTLDEARAAAREACAGALQGLGGPRAEAALVFATPEHGELARELLEAAAAGLGTRALAGASVHGLLAPGLESESGPAVGIVALTGVQARAFLLDDLHGDETRAGPELAARLGRPASARDLVLLFPDPDGLAPEALLAGLRGSLRPATLVGLGAAAGPLGAPLQWAEASVATGAVAALAIHGARPARVGVTQACRPVTAPLIVTRCRGHWVAELDGRPALDVYREVAREPLACDLRRAARFVLVAIPRPGAPGAYVVRSVSGFDPRSGAFAVPDRLAPGDAIALALREPEGARMDLKRMLAELAEPRPALGLYLGCCGRAAALFGVPGLEGGYLGSALEPAPVLGVLGALQIGPVAGRAEVLTQAGVLAALDP